MKTHVAVLRVWLLGAVLSGCGPTEDLVVTEARLVAPLPGQTTAVAYFTLRNSGKGLARLIGARSPDAGAIEIHTHVRDGDMMRMRRLDSVDTEPGATTVFAPGEHHLMVFRYTGPRQGSVAIELQIQDHAPVLVEFRAEERNGQDR